MNYPAVILTPNRRLSASLKRQHNAREISTGQTGWQTPAILPLQAWLQTLWQQCVMQRLPDVPPRLLSPAQEVLLWEQILAASDEHTLLLQAAPTAELAAQAWGLLKLWRVPLTHPLMDQTGDSRAFQRWADAFALQCQKNHWLDNAGLPDRLADILPECTVALPDHIALAGFTEIAPQYQALFDILNTAGCPVQTYQSHDREPHQTASTVCLADEDTEMLAMARWAKMILNEDNKNYVGCIIPRLDIQRDRVLQIFSEVFSDPLTLTAHHDRLPFNISAGKKLSDWPVIRTALLLLNATTRPLNEGETAELRHSPFSRSSTSLTDTACAPSVWAIRFSAYLNACGWPGERSLNSDEYQLCQRWLELLGEFATFDVLHPVYQLTDAVTAIQKLAERTVYQPSTPAAPVQISGILEAAGQSFSHLWIMGMDDSQWPFPPRPNPFIPPALQRTLQMPHATAERELHYCKTLFAQLREQSTHLVCSYAARADDNILRPASLLQDISIIAPEKLQLSPHTSPGEAILGRGITTELFVDDMAPSVANMISLRGGSRILSLQSACPFRAFAEIRLHARETDTPTTGLNARERGKLLHKTLELFWRETGDSSRLHQTNSRQRTEDCATEAVLFCTGQAPTANRYLKMEWERLVRLVSAWLDREMERPAFRVIACEAPLSVSLAGLTLELRMDRIDELPDGSHLIIDYKTGKHASPSNWFGDRPDEPQLPLYCIGTAPGTVSALAYAILHPETIKLTGFSAANTGIATIKAFEQWDNLITEWQHTLSRLAREFIEGYAAVDPKNGRVTCEHCHLQTLCRIHERSTYATG